LGPVFDAVEAVTILPSRADVVVIAGGIIGVSTALSLTWKGVSVVVCEKVISRGNNSAVT
jgi:glycine/D-amino acid oxidase-like deaminating enzyme